MAKADSQKKRTKSLKGLETDPLKAISKPLTSLEKIHSQINEFITLREAEIKHITELKHQLKTINKQVNVNSSRLNTLAEKKDFKKLKIKLKLATTEFKKNTQTLSQEILIFKSLTHRIQARIKLLEQETAEKSYDSSSLEQLALVEKITQFETQLKQFDTQKERSNQDLFEKVIAQTNSDIKLLLAEHSSNIQAESDKKYASINNNLNAHIQKLLAEKIPAQQNNPTDKLTAIIEQHKQHDLQLNQALSSMDELNSKQENLSSTINTIDAKQGDIESRQLEAESHQKDIEKYQRDMELQQNERDKHQLEMESRQREIESRQREIESRQLEIESRQRETESHQKDIEKYQPDMELQQNERDKHQLEMESRQHEIESRQLETESRQLEAESHQKDIEKYQRDMELQQNERDKHQRDIEMHHVASLNQFKNQFTKRSQLFLVGLLSIFIVSAIILIKNNSNLQADKSTLISEIKNDLNNDLKNELKTIIHQETENTLSTITTLSTNTQENNKNLNLQIKQLENTIQQIKYETKREQLIIQSQQAIFKKSINDLSTQISAKINASTEKNLSIEKPADTSNIKPKTSSKQPVSNKQIKIQQPQISKATPKTKPKLTPKLSKKSDNIKTNTSNEAKIILDLQNIKHPFYGIQLLGATKQRTIENFIKKHQLSSHARIHQKQYQGSPWFVLIYGQYSSSKAALKALKQLPEALQTNKPWVKKFH